MFPTDRPRRLRATPGLRRLVAETDVRPRHLVLPVFVAEGLDAPRPISSMPGVVQHTRDSLRKAAAEAASAGVGGIMLFGVPGPARRRRLRGHRPRGHPQRRAARRARRGRRRAAGHGRHVPRRVHRPRPLRGARRPRAGWTTTRRSPIYGQMAVAQAEAGAHVVAPSGMMDGQVGVIRSALDAAGHPDTAILAYSAKYASAFYGPFREAVDSQLVGDRRTYQQDPANAREARRETALDLAEGADMVMVKPAMAYLDVLRRVADALRRPRRRVPGLGGVRDDLRRGRARLARPRAHDPRVAHRHPAGRRRPRADLLGHRGRPPGWTAER